MAPQRPRENLSHGLSRLPFICNLLITGLLGRGLVYDGFFAHSRNIKCACSRVCVVDMANHCFHPPNNMQRLSSKTSPRLHPLVLRSASRK